LPFKPNSAIQQSEERSWSSEDPAVQFQSPFWLLSCSFIGKEGSKKAIAKFLQTDDPENLEASWQFGIDVIQRIPNVDPEPFKVILEERARTRPESRQGQARTVLR